MGLTGDFAALKRFVTKIGGLKTGDKGVADRIITEAMGPIRTLIAQEFASGTTPYGDAWQPKKDGGQPFAGSDAAGRVSLNKVGTAIIRAFPAYPMHFHQDGTKGGGRRAQRKMRAALRKEGYKRAGIKGILAEREKARAGAAFRVPPRPVIPTDDAGGIPKTWEAALTKAATKILAEAYATPKGGG